MPARKNSRTVVNDLKRQFLDREKLLADPEQARQVAQKIQVMLGLEKPAAIREFLKNYYPPDLAHVL
ncbi:MAG TPA: hypothetical protein VF478_12380, partial [Anaerolineae bacterium]